MLLQVLQQPISKFRSISPNFLYKELTDPSPETAWQVVQDPARFRARLRSSTGNSWTVPGCVIIGTKGIAYERTT
jgi:hypothetical protein